MRKKLVPIEHFIEWIKNLPYEETEKTPHTLEDSSADFKLKLETHSPAAERDLQQTEACLHVFDTTEMGICINSV
jgi:hypothetical protein